MYALDDILNTSWYNRIDKKMETKPRSHPVGQLVKPAMLEPTIPSRLIASPNFQNANLSISIGIKCWHPMLKQRCIFETINFTFITTQLNPACSSDISSCSMSYCWSNTRIPYPEFKVVRVTPVRNHPYRPAGSRENHLYPQIWF